MSPAVAMTAKTATVLKGSLSPSGCISVARAAPAKPIATTKAGYITANHQPQRSRTCRRLTFKVKMIHRLTNTTTNRAIDLAHAVELRDELDGRGQHPGYELDNEERDPKIEALDPTSKAE